MDVRTHRRRLQDPLECKLVVLVEEQEHRRLVQRHRQLLLPLVEPRDYRRRPERVVKVELVVRVLALVELDVALQLLRHLSRAYQQSVMRS